MPNFRRVVRTVQFIAASIAAIVLLAGCGTVSGQSHVRKNVSYFPDGPLESITYTYESRSGKQMFHGSWTEWYPDGKLRFFRQYVSNIPHGRWIKWNPEGRVKEIWAYTDGRVQSLWQIWSDTEQRLNGFWTEWDRDGRKVRERLYRSERVTSTEEVTDFTPQDLNSAGRYKKGDAWSGAFLAGNRSDDQAGFFMDYDRGRLIGKRDLSGNLLP